jgi:uncharacterized SAM-binding protein YcdF (DUF218 family)
MTLVLHKLLPLIVSPLGLVVALVVLSFVLRRRWLAGVGLAMLLVCALPLTGDRLWGTLEADYPYRPIESVETADAVVVLSGMLEWLEIEDSHAPQWGEATDRLFAGVDLLNAQKAPIIIFTRGQWPWVSLPPEGEILAERALMMGVNSNQILLTGVVTNTADEAGEVKSLMDFGGMRRVILVTSSFHMPRAKMLFDREGIETIPYPTDFRSSGGQHDWMNLLPSAGGLYLTSEAIRELIGRIYYRAMFASDE